MLLLIKNYLKLNLNDKGGLALMDFKVLIEEIAEKREYVAVCGKRGSGKFTLAMMIAMRLIDQGFTFDMNRNHEHDESIQQYYNIKNYRKRSVIVYSTFPSFYDKILSKDDRLKLFNEIIAEKELLLVYYVPSMFQIPLMLLKKVNHVLIEIDHVLHLGNCSNYFVGLVTYTDKSGIYYQSEFSIPFPDSVLAQQIRIRKAEFMDELLRIGE